MNTLLLLLALQVTAIGAGTGVEQRTLVGVASKFPADGQPVFVHATVANPDGPASVTWVWFKDGEERWRSTHAIEASPAWRTWTRMHMPKEHAGTWSVQLLDAQGAVLHAVVFDVVAPGG